MAWTPFRVMVLTVLCFDCLLRFGACQLNDGIQEALIPTPSIPRELMLPQRRTTELASLSVKDPLVNGTSTAYISQSTTVQFHLVLQLQDVGNESFCWIEVLNVVMPWELAWRQPCHPINATNCSVRFTTRGNLQLFLPEPMNVAWQTNTSASVLKFCGFWTSATGSSSEITLKLCGKPLSTRCPTTA